MSIHTVASTSSASRSSHSRTAIIIPLHQEERRTSKRRRLHTSHRAVKSCPASPEMSPESCSSQQSVSCAWEKLPVSAPATRTEFFPARMGPVSPPPQPASSSNGTNSAKARSRPSSVKLSLAVPPADAQTPFTIPPVIVGLPSPCTPISPVPSFSSSRKLRNAKQLSLVVPASTSSNGKSLLRLDAAELPSPNALDISETRSLPPTPRLAIHPVNGDSSICDQEMIDQESRDRLTSSLNGSMTMKRRTSLPRLNLTAARSLTLPLAKTGAASSSNPELPPTPSISRSPRLPLPLTVENLVARNREAGAPVAADSSEAEEEFPYQHGPKEILPGLYLGSEQNAKDPNILRQYGISTVLCVAKEVACPWLQEVSCPDIMEAEVEDEGDGTSSDSSDSATGSSLARPALHPPAPSDLLQPPRTSSPHPFLVRSSASTPNLQQRFRDAGVPGSSIAADAPTDPSLLTAGGAGRSTPSRTSTAHGGYLFRLFPQNRITGRPAISYTKLPWGHDEDDIASHFSTYSICELIDEARVNGGACLVHCQLGVSRSATLMIGYCMRQASVGNEEALEGIKTMHESYSYVRAKSRWVAPNIGLLAQLVQFEKVLAAKSTPGSLPYTNSAYYDSQFSLANASTPDNLSPSSTSDSELGSHLSTPESRTRFRRSDGKAVEEQLSPMTAAMYLSPAQEGFGSSDRKRDHRKTFSTDFSSRLPHLVKPELA